MSQKRIARMLKIACLAAAVLALPASLLGGPMMAEAVKLTLNLGPWPYRALVLVVLLTAALCYYALWRFYQVSTSIGEDRSFTMDNARAMADIARALFLASLLMALVFLLWWLPMLIEGRSLRYVQLYLPLLLSAGFGGVGLLAWALQQLVARAASLQEAQDLTI